MATNKIQTIYWFESSASMYSAINKLFTGNLDMEHFVRKNNLLYFIRRRSLLFDQYARKQLEKYGGIVVNDDEANFLAKLPSIEEAKDQMQFWGKI